MAKAGGGMLKMVIYIYCLLLFIVYLSYDIYVYE